MEQMKPLLCSCLREREMDRDVVNGGGETTRWTEKARHEEIMEENRQEGSERL